MATSIHDLASLPDLQHERSTGPQRVRRPVYRSLLPPCNAACPAGENAQRWLSLASAGRHREAWERIMRDNPLPATLGRVCYHPCELACNRARLDGGVGAHAVERFLGDLALREGWTVPAGESTGKRALVVGAGPGGLSCAYHLRRLGHEVTVRDAGPHPGGMMRFGIPAYRLPREVLEGEIGRIEAMGVEISLNHKVEDLAEERAGFDAVFVAVGAHLARNTDIPARDAGKVLDAVSFLEQAELGKAPRLGRRVAVYGGGNTAMDAARVARRLGVEPTIVYRRDRDHMPAHGFEADEALTEGVRIHWLRTIKSIEQDRLTVEEMELDEGGRPVPTGRFETLETDDLILALGQETDTGFLRTLEGIAFSEGGSVLVDERMATGCPGVFAGGDVVEGEKTVTVAIGHGKKAARNIDAHLRGEAYEKQPRHEPATLERLHLWFFSEAEQRPQGHLDLKRRRESFEEVVRGLTPEQATFEAKRCFSCGNCFECDGCYAACPEDAISKLGPGRGYAVDASRCTGCGTCFDQCPCGAIDLVTVEEAS